MLHGAYGERLGRSFHLSNPPTLVSKTAGGKPLAATEICFDQSHHGLSEPLACEDAYLIDLQLRKVDRYERWVNGHATRSPPLDVGVSCFYDLLQKPVLYHDDPFHQLSFYVPLSALLEVGDELGGHKIKGLVFEPGQLFTDPVIRCLGQSLLPYVRKDESTDQLVADYLLLALRAHLALNYGGVRGKVAFQQTGLAPWQQKRAKEFMLARVAEGVALAEVANACRLSQSAFVRAFRKSEGTTPHQWLMHKRVDRAIELMSKANLSLVEVALESGFADQSHFTRVFAGRTGVSPGAYRRSNLLIAN